MPAESREPSRGEESKDPDDFNGDGHRDLLLSVPVSGDEKKRQLSEVREQLAIVYGPSTGLDPATPAVHSRTDLGIPGPSSTPVNTEDAVPADLDGDGFSDIVTAASENYQERVRDGHIITARVLPYVTWSGPGGPGDPGDPVRHLRQPPHPLVDHDGYDGR